MAQKHEQARVRWYIKRLLYKLGIRSANPHADMACVQAMWVERSLARNPTDTATPRPTRPDTKT